MGGVLQRPVCKARCAMFALPFAVWLEVAKKLDSQIASSEDTLQIKKGKQIMFCLIRCSWKRISSILQQTNAQCRACQKADSSKALPLTISSLLYFSPLRRVESLSRHAKKITWG